jgi:hypothetical protein
VRVGFIRWQVLRAGTPLRLIAQKPGDWTDSGGRRACRPVLRVRLQVLDVVGGDVLGLVGEQDTPGGQVPGRRLHRLSLSAYREKWLRGRAPDVGDGEDSQSGDRGW